jgi:hypothetical protein
MDDSSTNLAPSDLPPHGDPGQPVPDSDEVARLRSDFQSRLLVASLRTEAIRAGMVDLDGLKLLDVSAIRLDGDDKIVGGRKIMEDLRRNKPWLFAGRSSSNTSAAPESQPVRQKTALEMTDEEYATARSAVTKYRF